jgi:hypothetical protein
MLKLVESREVFAIPRCGYSLSHRVDIFRVSKILTDILIEALSLIL